MNSKTTLESVYPDLSKKYWHPTKNGVNAPWQVSLKTHKKFWWQCPKGHEWEAAVAGITSSWKKDTKSKGCPYCQGSKVTTFTSLAYLEPEIAKSWDYEKNALSPSDFTRSSNHLAFWKCSKGQDHLWKTSIGNRIKQGCPVCSGKKPSAENNLEAKFPGLAKEWHPEKNDKLLPSQFTPGSNRKVWWLCPKNHEYKTKICHRALSMSKCPFCFGKKLSIERSLAFKRPDLSREFHLTRNDKNFDPSKIHASSRKKLWWICSEGHEWQATVDNRNKGNNCPYCTNRGGKVGKGRSLGDLYPDIVVEWDHKKNLSSPFDFAPKSNEKVWWVCSKNEKHSWETGICHRVNKTACPFCAGQKILEEESLLYSHPILVKEWHAFKNSNLLPNCVSAGSNQKVWWQCKTDKNHEWQAVIYNRTSKHSNGCPYCNSGWTVENIRKFVESMLPFIEILNEAELYTFFQQRGLLDIAKHAQGNSFVQAFKTGKFPREELEKFTKGQVSLVDDFLADSKKILECNQDLMDPSNEISEQTIDVQESLQITETKNVLLTIDSVITANLDSEVIEFFIKSAVFKVWKHAYINADQALVQLAEYGNNGFYAQQVTTLFSEDYSGAMSIELPANYKGKLIPNLMQKHTAYLIKKRKRIGNWSGTGAGKTLSAILASGIIDARMTVICCPNGVVNDWRGRIEEALVEKDVYEKEIKSIIVSKNQPQYLILNYEFFSQPRAEMLLEELLRKKIIDFVIIDEIHLSKQRDDKSLTQRKKILTAFLSEASQKNNNIHVLGMSATPVINNLFEGKTLIELITGIDHSDLDIKPTVPNCISLYQKFILHGIRWVPDFKLILNISTPEIDCSKYIDDIIKAMRLNRIVDLEKCLTLAKLPIILQNLQSKTVIYTHFRRGIESILYNAIVQQGWRVGMYNGDTKEGLKDFIYGDIDILIASSCIGTGIDNLQKVCNRLIVNSMPWTHAEFEQLVGRIYRQGQVKKQIDIIVPLTFLLIDGKSWSWCKSFRWNRIQFKKSISDAAVDGIVPEGHLRSPEQAFKDAKEWLSRLARGETIEIERQKITGVLAVHPQKNFIRKVGELSLLNEQINKEESKQTHQRFLNDADAWHSYHESYKLARKDWEVIPYMEAIEWCKSRPDLIVADFGCGEAFLADSLKNKVYSFDHIAINSKVVACDISNVPLESGSLHAAIFALSLMGVNFVDYLKEAYRCLKLDGHLWIAEPTSRITNIELFIELLDRLGFDIRRSERKGKFTFVQALKSERKINEVALRELLNTKILD